MRKHSKLLLAIITAVLLLNGAAVAEQEKLTIDYQNGLLSISADNILPENLFMALGKKCNIDIVTHGSVFPEDPVSISFVNIPVKDGVRRLVRAANLKNYLIDYQGSKPENKKFAKLELFIGGAGTKLLTKAVEQPAAQETVQENPKTASLKVKDIVESGALQNKKSFTEGQQVKWDGSAPLNFPEYQGKLPYDQSSFSWNAEAKNFSKRSMDLVPPAVRDSVAEYIIKECDEIAKERGATTITQDITAEALQRIANSANMPEMVKKNVPKGMEDLDKPRIPMDSDDLKPEYR